MLRFGERFPRLTSIMNATSLSIDERLRGKQTTEHVDVRKTITEFASNSGGMTEYGRDDERGCKAEHGCDRLTDAARHDVSTTSSSSSSPSRHDRRPISHGQARPRQALPGPAPGIDSPAPCPGLRGKQSGPPRPINSRPHQPRQATPNLNLNLNLNDVD